MKYKNKVTFRCVANNCLRITEKLKQERNNIWLGRLEAFLEAIKALETAEQDHFSGVDIMTIIDLDRLKVAGKDIPDVQRYLSTLPGDMAIDVDTLGVTHVNHLRVITLIIPNIIEFG